MSDPTLAPVLSRVFDELNIPPVLVDVGASGAPPAVWTPIAKQSIYIGFDPDLREIREVHDGQFYKSTIINEAVIAEERDEVHFYLTRSPYCSSTLEPDLNALSHYVFSDLFIVENHADVKATTLNAVARKFNLSSFDWIKVDTQGTDLRLYTTLNADLRSRVLALDVEPGLIDAYKGEDLYIDTHRTLTKSGFWLSNLDIQGTVRVKQQTLRQALSLPEIHYGVAGSFLKRSPGWCEARYLRTIESLIESSASEREFGLLWVFSMLDEQVGFALDVALAAAQQFPKSALMPLLKNEVIAQIQARYKATQSTPTKVTQPAELRYRIKHIAKRIAQRMGISLVNS